MNWKELFCLIIIAGVIGDTRRVLELPDWIGWIAIVSLLMIYSAWKRETNNV